MIRIYLVGVVLVLFMMTYRVFAQDEDIQSAVDYKVNKMQKELNLTDSQVYAIKPIVKDYMIKRHTILQEAAGEGIVDHVAIKGALEKVRDVENQQLSKVLSVDQLNKLINKENLMAAMNPDSAESEDEDGVSLNGEGVDLKF